MGVELPDDFKTRANELLEKKFEDVFKEKSQCLDRSTQLIDSSQDKGKFTQLNLLPEKTEWRILATERLQMLEQFRDEMHAWYDAYLKEKERADRLEIGLFKALGVDTTPSENTEQKIVIKPQEQIRHANRHMRRAMIEKHFAGAPSIAEIKDGL